MLILAEFIEYDRNGNVILKAKLDFTRYSCHGQKTRITTKDGRQYIGYMDYHGKFKKGTINPAGTPAVFELRRFDIDPKTKKVRDDDGPSIFVPLALITRVEAIEYSGPRWGIPPNNEFRCHLFAKAEVQKAREYIISYLEEHGINLPKKE